MAVKPLPSKKNIESFINNETEENIKKNKMRLIRIPYPLFERMHKVIDEEGISETLNNFILRCIKLYVEIHEQEKN